MSDPNQPPDAVLERRIAKISRLLEAARFRVECSCDFTEQNQHADCPAFLVNAAADLAFKWSTPAPASGEGEL